MTLQRYFLQATKQLIIQNRILKCNVKSTYCILTKNYSSSVAGRKFTERHEWVKVDKDTGTVGISKYAQESLGDVVFAELPDLGVKLKAGDECGVLESVKAASDIFTPVSGIVTDKNKAVEQEPALINTSCYEKGWLFKLKLTEPEELNNLMTEDEYEKFLKHDVEKLEK